MSKDTVTYVDRYGEARRAQLADDEYDPDDLWEGVDYAATDLTSELPVVLNWDHGEGWAGR